MRQIRSLTALRAAESVARLGSVSAAALELNVSRPAISKQIALLERDMGCQFFIREGNRIRLTMAGTELLAGLQPAFDLIAATTDKLARHGARLRILVCRDFASSWLAGQVATFLAGNPGISVEITAERNGNFRLGEDFDFRIFYGADAPQSPPGLTQIELCRWIDMPVCAPSFAAQYLQAGQSLSDAPQLVDGNYDIWQDWCLNAGFDPSTTRQRTVFNETTLCMSVAAAGGGIAIGDSFLCMPLIRQGRLILPFKIGLISAQTYSVFTAATHNRAAGRFLIWLRAAVAAHQATILDELATLGVRVIQRA